jgi:hypothetical protein
MLHTGCCCRRLYGELQQRDMELLHTQQQLQQLRGSVHGLLSGLQVRLLTNKSAPGAIPDAAGRDTYCVAGCTYN